MTAVYIILTASLISVSCGILGSFLILRKMAMLGDAISHAVLPGIVIAFLVSGSRSSIPMLIGAALLGLMATILIEVLHKKARLQEDAAIGVTFTWLFAIGVILISSYTGQVDLDQECVLYGEIAYVPLDPLVLGSGQMIGPKALYISGGVLILILLMLRIGYKGLVLTTFNDDFARAIGLRSTLWHFVFMGMVSLTTVVSFESVGAILVVALLIAPPAAAYLLTDSLKRMLLYSAFIGVVCSVSGYYLARAIDGSIAGAMATCAGLVFGLSFAWYKMKAHRKLQNIPTNISALKEP